MIKKIPAWKCTVCKKIMIGSKTEAEEHEKLPVVEPLPSGFVYFDKNQDTYEVVSKKPGRRLENHDYRQEIVSFNKGLKSYRPHYERVDYVRTGLGFGHWGRLFARFEKFRLMYSKLDPELKREIGVQAKDLTNRL